MKMSGERTIAAPQSVVWDALNDETLLLQCIPGCTRLERVAEDRLEAAVDARVGPVRASFKGEMRIEDAHPPERYRLVGQGKGAAGFARGHADVTLRETDDGRTLLGYDATGDVGGKLAQIGARLIESTGQKYADSFFETFGRLAAERAAPAEVEVETEAAPRVEELPAALEEAVRRPGLHPALWTTILILAVLLLLYLLAG